MAQVTGEPAVPGYKVAGLVGLGRAGAVYAGHPDGEPGRTVALKVLACGRDAAIVAELARLVEALRALRHPAVLPVDRLVVAGGGERVVIVTELAARGSLAGGSAPGECIPRAVETRVQWCSALAGGLDQAHRRGIVHGNVKPANVVLSAAGSPQLTDFGIATILSGPRGAAAVEYADPALLRGAAPGVASDVYSLGALAYEIFAGRPPFSGATAAETSRRAARGRPVPLRRLCPSLPAETCRAVHAALSRDPSGRPRSAGELAEILDASPGAGAPGPPVEPAPRPGAARVLLPRGATCRSAAPQPASESPPVPLRRPPAPARKPPAPARKRRRTALALLTGLLLVGGLAAELVAGGPGAQRGALPGGVLSWHAGTATVRQAGWPGARRYALGSPGDQLLTGDWYCTGRESPALYRASTGEVYFFRGWGDEASSDARATGVRGGSARVVRRGCGDGVGIDAAGPRGA